MQAVFFFIKTSYKLTKKMFKKVKKIVKKTRFFAAFDSIFFRIFRYKIGKKIKKTEIKEIKNLSIIALEFCYS